MVTTDHIADLKATAQRHAGTLGPACMTCAFWHRESFSSGQCGFYATSAYTARLFDHRCGPKGRDWEPRPRRVGLIPWLLRVLWGDAS